MAETTIQRLIASRQRELRRRVGSELAVLRLDRELSLREVSTAAGLDRRWLARAELGDANLTLDALAAIATVLGAEASLRLYAALGPRLVDHLQARMLETLLVLLHVRWRRLLEVPVYRPVRGVVDLVLVDRQAGDIVSGEAHSEIRRAEQQIRWATEKADSLASASGWPWGATDPRQSRLLLLRSTPETRATIMATPALFMAAYPGSTAEAVTALRSASGRFPEPAMIWFDVRGTASRLLDGPPRGVTVGR